MKLIWLLPDIPYPANTGGRIAMLKRIEYLSKNNDIYLFCVIDNEDDIKYKSELEKYCKKIFFYLRKKNIISKIQKIILGPYIASSRWNCQLKKDIQKELTREHTDFIIIDFPQMLGNLNDKIINKHKIILNQHNIEWKTLLAFAKTINSPIKKIIYYIESYRLKHLEYYYYSNKNINLYTFVSSEDEKYFKTEFPLNKTLLSPIGSEIPKVVKKEHPTKNILFVGKMSYLPNIEGIRWFIEKIFSQLSLKLPDCKLYIVGKDPDDNLKSFAAKHKNIIITGTVENVEEYYELADIVILPLLNGGGVKVKLLEALGYGKIVISTSKGVEGTNFQDQIDLLITNDKNKFYQYCYDSITNPNKYIKLPLSARKKIEQEYTWKAIMDNYEKAIKKLI